MASCDTGASRGSGGLGAASRLRCYSLCEFHASLATSGRHPACIEAQADSHLVTISCRPCRSGTSEDCGNLCSSSAVYRARLKGTSKISSPSSSVTCKIQPRQSSTPGIAMSDRTIRSACSRASVTSSTAVVDQSARRVHWSNGNRRQPFSASSEKQSAVTDNTEKVGGKFRSLT